MSTDDDSLDDGQQDDRPIPIDDRPDWLRDADDATSAQTARTFQFSLAALFWLMTVCGVYFFLEKTHGGMFGLHALAAAGLLFGVGLPVVWFLLWAMHRLIEFGTWVGMLLLAFAIIAMVVFSLTRFPGF
jgi:hypothetical protein